MRAIETQGENFNLNDVSLLDACRILKKAWEDVSLRTIRNSFIHSGLISDQFEEEDLLPLPEWLTTY